MNSLERPHWILSRSSPYIVARIAVSAILSGVFLDLMATVSRSHVCAYAFLEEKGIRPGIGFLHIRNGFPQGKHRFYSLSTTFFVTFFDSLYTRAGP